MPARGPALWALLALFVASRLGLLLAFAPEHTDAEELYRGYAMTNLLAEKTGRSAYRLNQQRRALEKRVDAGAGQIEYPPLGLALLTLPGRAAGPLTDQTATAWGIRYLLLYRGLMVAFEALALGVVVASLGRFAPGAGAREIAFRVAVPVVGGLALFYLLLDRLDLTMAALLSVALALLCSARHWLLSFAVLALAINFKLVPLLLAPVWVVGSLRPARAPWAGIVGRSLALGALVVAVFLPFVVASGADALGFLRFHAERGLQIESALASVVLLLRSFGLDYKVVLAHGSVVVSSSAARVAAGLSLLLLVAVGVTELLVLLRLAGAEAERTPPRAERARTLAQRRPDAIVLVAISSLMAAILCSKVFSPQYLIWLLPLVPLLPLPPRPRAWFFGGFLATCVLSTVIFPFAYQAVSGVGAGHHGEDVFLTGPTAVGVALLLVRNALFGWLTVWLARRTWSTSW